MTSYNDYMTKTNEILTIEDESEARERSKLALEFHVEQMAQQGLVFSHVLKSPYLGFSVCLARLRGDAVPRDIVMVSRVDVNKCQIDGLSPGDELIEVDGEMIVAPDARTFRRIQKSIYTPQRSAKRQLRFIRGVRTAEERMAATVPVSPQARPPQYSIFNPPSVALSSKARRNLTPAQLETARAALARHVENMDAAGLVVRHTFTENTLGLSMALASTRDALANSNEIIANSNHDQTDLPENEDLGRDYLLVTRTDSRCPLYPDRLKPGDELVAVEDALVVLPDVNSFPAIIDAIIAAPRPLQCTFIEGPDRNKRFAAQEEQLRLAADANKAKKVALAAMAMETLNKRTSQDDDDCPSPRTPRSPLSPRSPRTSRAVSAPEPYRVNDNNNEKHHNEFLVSKTKNNQRPLSYQEQRRDNYDDKKKKHRRHSTDTIKDSFLREWPILQYFVGGAEDFLCGAGVGCDVTACSAPPESEEEDDEFSPVSLNTPYFLDDEEGELPYCGDTLDPPIKPGVTTPKKVNDNNEQPSSTMSKKKKKKILRKQDTYARTVEQDTGDEFSEPLQHP